MTNSAENSKQAETRTRSGIVENLSENADHPRLDSGPQGFENTKSIAPASRETTSRKKEELSSEAKPRMDEPSGQDGRVVAIDANNAGTPLASPGSPMARPPDPSDMPVSTKTYVGWVLLMFELASVAAMTMIGALVFAAFVDRRLPPVVFGPLAYSQTQIPPPPPPVLPPTVSATYSVFFNNGSSTIDPTEARLLRSLARGLADCAGVQISVVGSTSSLAYLNDPKDVKNDDLAHRRAESVAQYLTSANSSLADRVKTSNAPKRRYNDARVAAAQPRATELLNRRVDLLMTESDCSLPASASTTGARR